MKAAGWRWASPARWSRMATSYRFPGSKQKGRGSRTYLWVCGRLSL